MTKNTHYNGRLKFTARLSALLNQSDSEGSNPIYGGRIDAVLAPYYLISDSSRFILMYDGAHYKKREFYSDGNGPLQRVKFQRHKISPMFRYMFGPGLQYSVTTSLFQSFTYNKDYKGAKWQEGLYNYRDTGCGIDFKGKGFGFAKANGTIKLGIQIYDRDYPNYQSLLSMLDNDREKDEKNYLGTTLITGYRWQNQTGFSWETEYQLLIKLFDDKKIDHLDYSKSDKQRDHVHSLHLDFWYRFKFGLNLGVDLNTVIYESNQNFIDSNGTQGFDDDFYMTNYYDYKSYRIRPNISYTFKKIPFTIYYAYSFQDLDYKNRKARNSAGSYYDADGTLHGTQSETQTTHQLRLYYRISDMWGIVGQYQYLSNKSNNDYERGYVYNYKVHDYSLGFTLKY